MPVVNFGNLLILLVQIVVESLVITPIVWLAVRLVIGKGIALSRAFLIALLGNIPYILFFGLGSSGSPLGDIFYILFFGFGGAGFGLVSIIVMIGVWIALFKFFYNCSWSKALTTAILSLVIIAVILVVLGFLRL